MDRVVRELGLLVRTLKGLHSHVLAEVGVRVEMPAAAVLATLEGRGPVRVSTLADALGLDLSSVSRQVAALEREGWVGRERDPGDSRAALLDVTDEGRAALARLRSAQAEHLARRLPDWTQQELADFAAQLSRFRTDLARTGDTASTSSRGPLGSPAASSAPAPHQVPALAGQETS